MFGEPGAEISTQTRLPIYRSMIEFTGRRPIPCRSGRRTASPSRRRRRSRLITPRTRLSSSTRPRTHGGVTPKAEIDRLVPACRPSGTRRSVGRDLRDHDLRRRAAPLAAGYPRIRERLIHLDGASKTYAMTGWRLGWSVWPKPLYDAARKLCVNAHSCVNAATQWAGVAALNGPQDDARAMTAEFDRRRALVVEGLNRLPASRASAPKGAYYAIPRVPHGLGRRRRSPPRCWRRRASPRLAGRISRPRRGLTSACPTPTRPRISLGRWSGWRIPGRAEGGVRVRKAAQTLRLAAPRRCG
jgi:hypothetical protein